MPNHSAVVINKTIVINETKDFFILIIKRDDGCGPRRWKFFELINKRNDTFIKQDRVMNILKRF